MDDRKYSEEITIPSGEINLKGFLSIPGDCESFVLFSHGAGSSRHSTRNKFVADELHKNNIGSLLFDLLTEEEDMDYSNRFDIELLTQRLIDVTNWSLGNKALSYPPGYFGASTGAASALFAAAELKDKIKAVVSRGGRPDLALEALQVVISPVLLIVGELDRDVLKLNELAYSKLECEKELIIIPGATHLFEEPGTLKEAANHSVKWFKKYLK